jgi:hypothetical protein
MHQNGGERDRGRSCHPACCRSALRHRGAPTEAMRRALMAAAEVVTTGTANPTVGRSGAISCAHGQGRRRVHPSGTMANQIAVPHRRRAPPSRSARARRAPRMESVAASRLTVPHGRRHGWRARRGRIRWARSGAHHVESRRCTGTPRWRRAVVQVNTLRGASSGCPCTSTGNACSARPVVEHRPAGASHATTTMSCRGVVAIARLALQPSSRRKRARAQAAQRCAAGGVIAAAGLIIARRWSAVGETTPAAARRCRGRPWPDSMPELRRHEPRCFHTSTPPHCSPKGGV